MKLLHVLAQLPSRTGSGVYFTNLIKNLRRYDYQQKAVFGTQDDYIWDGLEREDIYPVEFKTDELSFPIVGMSDIMPYDNTLYSAMTEDMIDRWIEAFKTRLLDIRRSYKPDIIFTHHLWMLSSLVVDVFAGTKVVGVFHNTELRQARMNPELYNRYVNGLENLDLIFVASDQQADAIREIYTTIGEDKIISIGGGFDQDIFYPPGEKQFDQKVRLVYAGKIDPSKGIYELLDVYRELDLDDITLDIIGMPDRENKEKLEGYIGNDASVRVYNVKDQVALGEELRQKDIFLMPSFYEGLGLMAVESLASGLYVIATEIEALMRLLGEDIRRSGIIEYVPLPRIYDVDKPMREDLSKFRRDLRTAMLKQIDKVRDGKTHPIDAREGIKKLSWATLVDNIAEIIEDL
ncbi:MAG: glycosyltransferase family 4 protein [Tissierellia bacterium]|nr:glycosyltransferase family 4 protein [Tissierellia bacterium]